MQNLFDPADRAAIAGRLDTLHAESSREWGRMTPPQALAHCAAALEVACGDRPKTRMFIGRLLAPFVRASVLGDKPFARNSPTDRDFIVADDRNLDAERQRVMTLVDRFCAAGPAGAEGRTHSFFGPLSGDEWGRLMYKHLDHHLRQFGA